MKRTLLITNTSSGSASGVDEQTVVASLRQAGLDVVERRVLPEQDLPAQADLDVGCNDAGHKAGGVTNAHNTPRMLATMAASNLL